MEKILITWWLFGYFSHELLVLLQDMFDERYELGYFKFTL